MSLWKTCEAGYSAASSSSFLVQTMFSSSSWAYGVCAADAKVPVSPYDIFSQEYTILGSFAQTHCFGRALEYLESGAVQVKELISHELPLEDYGKGLDYIVQKQARKVIIHP